MGYLEISIVDKNYFKHIREEQDTSNINQSQTWLKDKSSRKDDKKKGVNKKVQKILEKMVERNLEVEIEKEYIQMKKNADVEED